MKNLYSFNSGIKELNQGCNLRGNTSYGRVEIREAAGAYRDVWVQETGDRTQQYILRGNAHSSGGIRNSIGHFGYEMVARHYCIVLYCFYCTVSGPYKKYLKIRIMNTSRKSRNIEGGLETYGLERYLIRYDKGIL